MSDFIQDVRDYFADRFSSPLWISIIVSWLLLNWQLPITAIFETEKFSVAFILEHSRKSSHWCLITIPILLGLAYSIFSSSMKETLELLSKAIRNLIAKADRNGRFYESISMIEHKKQLSKLDRQLEKIERHKAELADLHEENKNLNTQIAFLKGELKNREDYHAQNSKLAQENHILNERISVLEEKNKNSLQNKGLLEKNELPNTHDSKRDNRAVKEDAKLYEKIISRCSNNVQSQLEDPSSLASLFITLYLAKAGRSYTLQEIIDKSGFKDNIVGETLKIAIDAQLIQFKSEQISFTELGITKYKELMQNKSLSELTQSFELVDKETTAEILGLLKEKALSRKVILQLIDFNPNADKVLGQLRETKKITLSGSVYFINHQE